MHIVVHDTMASIDAQQWTALLHDNNPFMRHEFLLGLENCGCVQSDKGWQPSHIAVYSDVTNTRLLGAMPCYIKDHSYGEYIFDWSWAEAYHRHGLNYYPKLSNAVPFTPASGQRWLCAEQSSSSISAAVLNQARSIVEDQQLSSFHSLFLTSSQAQIAEQSGLSVRQSSQFHWQNRDYQSFDEFLAGMTSKKRKNIKRERRRIEDAGITYQWLTGEALTEQAVSQMTQFYLRTIGYYGAKAYLNEGFFKHLAEHLADQTLILFARLDNKIIAGGLFLRSNNTLYGRYWGAQLNFDSVHFETCYYQPIEWCITHGIERFEAGAQGEHKLARGLEPATTYSAHWIAHPHFRAAIDDFIDQEAQYVLKHQDALNRHSPFKQEDYV